jgi:tRNA-binding EMAP/Myf-like protein
MREGTGAPSASRVYVVQIDEIFPHPNADRLEILRLTRPGWGIEIVAGKHYRKGQLGVYLPANALLPGWLAEDMWMVGSGNANRWVKVTPKMMRGIPSAGLFAGQTYMKVRDDDRSVRRYAKLEAEGGSTAKASPDGEEWVTWPIWQPRWKVGDDVGDYIGVQCPDSSVSEHLLVKQEVGQTANVPGLDSPSGLQPKAMD